jgi:hypothetical protein
MLLLRNIISGLFVMALMGSPLMASDMLGPCVESMELSVNFDRLKTEPPRDGDWVEIRYTKSRYGGLVAKAGLVRLAARSGPLLAVPFGPL